MDMIMSYGKNSIEIASYNQIKLARTVTDNNVGAH